MQAPTGVDLKTSDLTRLLGDRGVTVYRDPFSQRAEEITRRAILRGIHSAIPPPGLPYPFPCRRAWTPTQVATPFPKLPLRTSEHFDMLGTTSWNIHPEFLARYLQRRREP